MQQADRSPDGLRDESTPARPSSQEKGIHAVAVTARGAQIAVSLAAALPSVRAHVPARFVVPELTETPSGTRKKASDMVLPYSCPARELVQELFGASRGLILIMATGAAMRLIAPCLRDKESDPAIVAVDDAGRFAISLLSGHLGGANMLAEQIARVLGATPVITTASESAGVPAADLIGSEFGWKIEPGSALKTVAAALVNGDPVGVYQEAGEQNWLAEIPPNIRFYPSLSGLIEAKPAAAIIISDRVLDLPPELHSRSAIYRPATLVLGIGCVRGVTAAEIAALVDETLALHRLSPLSVRSISSIDRKSDEPGLLQFSEARTWPLVTYSAAELASVQADWSHSKLVDRAVGVGGVAEPAALLCAAASSLLVRKVKTGRVTLAIVRKGGAE